jgi:parvulin-like peptidyl-prolyl isomerase
MNSFAPFARRPGRAARRSVRTVAFVIAASMIAASSGAQAQERGETVLVRRGDAAITYADFVSEVQRLPDDARATLAGSEKHVIALLDRLLIARELAGKARARNLDAGLALDGLAPLDQEKLLASAWIASVEEAAGREFDARGEAWQRRAREIYLSDRSRYTVPEKRVATQMLFAAGRGGPEEARTRALGAASRLAGGDDFDAMVLAVSDEPNVAQTRGRIGPVARERLAPQVGAAVFALARPGDVSAPVESTEGWYLFRLDSLTPGHVQPFDEVGATIVAELRRKEIERAREGIYTDLRANNQNVTVNEPALRALKTAPELVGDAARPPASSPPVPAAR